MNQSRWPQFPEKSIPHFCTRCGAAVVDRCKPRHPYTCAKGHLVFVSPQLVSVGILFVHDRVVMNLRGPAVVQPHYWGLPGGFTEWGELSSAGAARECWEECFGGPDGERSTALRAMPEPKYVGEYVGTEAMAHLIFWAMRWPDGCELGFGYPDGREVLEVGIFKLDDLPEPLAFPYQVDFIQRARALV